MEGDVKNSKKNSNITCGNCGTENLENARFCAECGEEIVLNSSTQNCPGCGGELAEGARFCAECGEDVLSLPEKALQNICPGCGYENPENSKFCADCGKLMPVDESQLLISNFCPECGFQNSENSQFCAECGKTLPLINSTETVCPKCNHMNLAGATFCAECGKTLFEKKDHRKKRPMLDEIKSESSNILNNKSLKEIKSHSSKVISEKSPEFKSDSNSNRTRRSFDNVKSEKKSSSSTGIGGLFGKKSSLKKGLNKTLGEIEEKTQPHLNNIDSSLNNLQNKEKENYGYLICDSCSGYYELQEGESINDFEGCNCGGNFIFARTLN